MDANYAEQNQRFTLADNAYLEYLPGPTIPHRNARFITDTACHGRAERHTPVLGDPDARAEVSRRG